MFQQVSHKCTRRGFIICSLVVQVRQCVTDPVESHVCVLQSANEVTSVNFISFVVKMTHPVNMVWVENRLVCVYLRAHCCINYSTSSVHFLMCRIICFLHMLSSPCVLSFHACMCVRDQFFTYVCVCSVHVCYLHVCMLMGMSYAHFYHCHVQNIFCLQKIFFLLMLLFHTWLLFRLKFFMCSLLSLHPDRDMHLTKLLLFIL